ncbi:MAG: LysM peptidoglycan-binding domain-containing protein [Elusimicrobia bacterium]|nr:LysM peptidoglycan-binding domain-containing protein [Elusimicrobiota bacterium]
MKNNKEKIPILSRIFIDLILFVILSAVIISISVDDFPGALFRLKTREIEHTLSRGEKLGDVSMRYGVPALDIAAYNNIEDGSALEEGNVLRIKSGLREQDRAIYLSGREVEINRRREDIGAREKELKETRKRLEQYRGMIDDLSINLKYSASARVSGETEKEYNGLVGEYNALLGEYSGKYDEYQEEFDSLDSMIDWYNGLVESSENASAAPGGSLGMLSQIKMRERSVERESARLKSQKMKMDEMKDKIDELWLEIKYPASGTVSQYKVDDFRGKTKIYDDMMREYDAAYRKNREEMDRLEEMKKKLKDPE